MKPLHFIDCVWCLKSSSIITIYVTQFCFFVLCFVSCSSRGGGLELCQPCHASLTLSTRVFVAFGAFKCFCVLRVITDKVESDSHTLHLLEFPCQAKNLNQCAQETLPA